MDEIWALMESCEDGKQAETKQETIGEDGFFLKGTSSFGKGNGISDFLCTFVLIPKDCEASS